MDFSRQVGIFDPRNFDQHRIAIIGCGGIGSAVGLALAKLGLKNFTLFDGDYIEDHNIPNQLLLARNGEHKNRSLSNIMSMFVNEDLDIKLNDMFSNESSSGVLDCGVVIAATDSMSSRLMILYELMRNRRKPTNTTKLLIDARMAGNLFVVFTVDLTDKKSIVKYMKTFHPNTQQTCTERAIIYNLFGVASIVCNQVKKVFNGEDYPFEVTFDYNNYFMEATDPTPNSHNRLWWYWVCGWIGTCKVRILEIYKKLKYIDKVKKLFEEI